MTKFILFEKRGIPESDYRGEKVYKELQFYPINNKDGLLGNFRPIRLKALQVGSAACDKVLKGFHGQSMLVLETGQVIDDSLRQSDKLKAEKKLLNYPSAIFCAITFHLEFVMSKNLLSATKIHIAGGMSFTEGNYLLSSHLTMTLITCANFAKGRRVT